MVDLTSHIKVHALPSNVVEHAPSLVVQTPGGLLVPRADVPELNRQSDKPAFDWMGNALQAFLLAGGIVALVGLAALMKVFLKVLFS